MPNWKELGGLDKVSLGEVLEECEQGVLEWALARSGGNQAKAAKLIGIPRTTLRSRLAARRSDNSSEGTD